MERAKKFTFNKEVGGYEKADMAKFLGFKIPVFFDDEMYREVMDIDDSAWTDERQSAYFMRAIAILSSLGTAIHTSGGMHQEIAFTAGIQMCDGMESQKPFVAARERFESGDEYLMIYLTD